MKHGLPPKEEIGLRRILIDLHKHNFLANNGIIGNTWTAYGINAVNEALPDTDEDGTKQLRTVRIFLLPPLIYTVVKLITSGADAPQSSCLEVFDFVEAELLDVLGLTRAQVLAGDAPTVLFSQ